MGNCANRVDRRPAAASKHNPVANATFVLLLDSCAHQQRIAHLPKTNTADATAWQSKNHDVARRNTAAILERITLINVIIINSALKSKCNLESKQFAVQWTISSHFDLALIKITRSTRRPIHTHTHTPAHSNSNVDDDAQCLLARLRFVSNKINQIKHRKGKITVHLTVKDIATKSNRPLGSSGCANSGRCGIAYPNTGICTLEHMQIFIRLWIH